MADFNVAIKHILAHEGGFVDNPNDRGGATKYGITQRTLDAFLNSIGNPTYSVDQLDKTQAEFIYLDNYWNKCGLEGCKDTALATIILDTAVLRGNAAAIKGIQKALHLVEDGSMGPKTAAALNMAKPKELALAIISTNIKAFAELAAKDSRQLTFLAGWINRQFELIKLLMGMV